MYGPGLILVCWCFNPTSAARGDIRAEYKLSQLLWIISWLNTMSLSYSVHKSATIFLQHSYFKPPHTHTKPHVFLQNHNLSLSQGVCQLATNLEVLTVQNPRKMSEKQILLSQERAKIWILQSHIKHCLRLIFTACIVTLILDYMPAIFSQLKQQSLKACQQKCCWHYPFFGCHNNKMDHSNLFLQ